jgi:predicted HTH domain antitoxin
LPADFVSRAVRAYEQADISLNRLSELLEKDRDELEDTLTELGIIQQEPDIIEGMDEI